MLNSTCNTTISYNLDILKFMMMASDNFFQFSRFKICHVNQLQQSNNKTGKQVRVLSHNQKERGVFSLLSCFAKAADKPNQFFTANTFRINM